MFRWFWIFVNANLVHKFSITDEEYNLVEGSILNVKQKVPFRMATKLPANLTSKQLPKQ